MTLAVDHSKPKLYHAYTRYMDFLAIYFAFCILCSKSMTQKHKKTETDCDI